MIDSNTYYSYEIERVWRDGKMEYEELKEAIVEAILCADEMQAKKEDESIRKNKTRKKTVAVVILCSVVGLLRFAISIWQAIACCDCCLLFEGVIWALLFAVCGYSMILIDKCRNTVWSATFLSILIACASVFISLLGK